MMDLNITLIVLFLCGLVGLYWGWGKGFTKSISNFLAVVATMVTLVIFLRIYHTYTNGQTLDTIKAVVALVIFGAIYGLLNFIIKSAKAIANLPVISVLDKVLGSVLGLGIVIVLYHMLIDICSFGYLGNVGIHILNDVENDQWLTMIASVSLTQLFVQAKDKLIELFGSIK